MHGSEAEGAAVESRLANLLSVKLVELDDRMRELAALRAEVAEVYDTVASAGEQVLKECGCQRGPCGCTIELQPAD